MVKYHMPLNKVFADFKFISDFKYISEFKV